MKLPAGNNSRQFSAGCLGSTLPACRNTLSIRQQQQVDGVPAGNSLAGTTKTPRKLPLNGAVNEVFTIPAIHPVEVSGVKRRQPKTRSANSVVGGYMLTLRPIAGSWQTSPEQRLKFALKALARAYGLRCVACNPEA
jgi:hypothetical protein